MQRPAMTWATPALCRVAWLGAAIALACVLLSALLDGRTLVNAGSHCPSGFLSCYDGECLRQSKFCDGHQDCKDNSDELDCDAPCHPPDLFRCHNGMCISHLFVCDGAHDCNDGSDEKDCHDQSQVESDPCTENEFRCGDNLCIPIDWKCDGNMDCLDGTDETIGCTTRLACNDRNLFLCSNHHCIPVEWRCDGHDDCLDNSDELGCSHLTDPMKVQNCPLERGLYPCGNRVDCASLSELCNGIKECPDGTDEDDAACNKSLQRCTGFGCSNKCVPTPRGPLCICPKGFEITQVKYCADIDECQQYGICSQKCKNTPGSYRCECAAGFTLQSDNKTCKAGGPDPLLVFSMKTEVRALELRSQIYFPVVKEQKHIIGVAYDGTHMYWTTVVDGEEAIVRSNKDGSNREIIVTTGLHLPEDLAIDWLTGNIYFTDSEMDHIGVCNSSGKICTILVNEDIDSPRSIALHITQGVVFWTDWGHKPMIARSGMDGSSPAPFVSDKIQWPGGLALDTCNERVYWVDTKLEIVESIKLDGTDRRTILTEVLKHPYALAIFEENLYWSDFVNSEILSCNKFTGKNIQKIVYSRNHYFYGLHVYHPSMQPEDTVNPCRDTPCSDMCLLAPNSTYSCACPENKLLREDKHSCRDIEKHEGLAIGGGNKLVQLIHNTFGKQEMTQRSFEHLEKIGALAYNNIHDSIFISDISRKEISILDLQSSTLAPLVSHEIGTVVSLSYDHLADNLYWCDSERGIVEVMSLSSLKRKVIYKGFAEETPINIVVVPEKGVMFVGLRKVHGVEQFHIDKMNMDGTGGAIHFLESNLEGPTVSLTYDSQLDELVFADSGRGSIESCELDGTNHVPLQSLSHSPLSVTTLGNELLWTSRESTHLYWSNKMRKFSKVKALPLGMFNGDRIFLAPLRGTISRPNHPCRNDNGGCSHLCLVSLNKMVCVCPEGQVLEKDNRTCSFPKHCTRQEFKCEQEKKCIPSYKRCDGHADCEGNEDENDCPGPCLPNQFECKDGQCIPHFQHCDDQIQCEDASDEFNCHTEICLEDQFMCSSGECISSTWKCDSHDDCKDGSDEFDCTEVVCPPGKFTCKSGTCIPITWECDNEVNCPDGSDEHEGCPPIVCAPEDFRCSNNRCIDISLKCNGEDECGDNSDEEDCVKETRRKKIQRCTENQFRCDHESILCLPIAVRCNGTAECPKGDDEAQCGCSMYEFECDHNKCIVQNWVCDGQFDCIDKSDEEPRLCEKKSTVSGPCLGYQCSSGQCIDLSQACDGNSDCSDNSDEGGKCDVACNRGNPCDSVCNPTPSGPQCSCHAGFTMRSDSSQCVDDDECSQNICSQICANTLGSFTCSCMPGYLLRLDRTSCKAEGQPLEVIFVANGNEIRIAPFSLHKIRVLHQDMGMKISSLDVNIQRKVVYWSNGRGTIFFKSLQHRTLRNITGVGKAMKIAVDWITDNIYFTDEIENSIWIKVCNLESLKCSKLIEAEIGLQIDNIVIDPISGYLFWTEGREDLDSGYALKRADMTGANSLTLIHGLSLVQGLATDLAHRWVFWADRIEAEVGAVGYNGAGRHLVLHQKVKHVSGLALHEDSLYLISQELGRLLKCKIFGRPQHCDWVELNTHNVNNFALVQEQHQTKGENKCELKSCSHLCVLSPSEPNCICPDGSLVEEKTSCAVIKHHVEPLPVDNHSASHQELPKKGFPYWGVFMLTLFVIVLLFLLGVVYKDKLRISTPDFSRSVRFITSPYNAIKNAATGNLNLDSKLENEEEMEDVFTKKKVETQQAGKRTPPANSTETTDGVPKDSRVLMHVQHSDFVSSDEETDFTDNDKVFLLSNP